MDFDYKHHLHPIQHNNHQLYRLYIRFYLNIIYQIFKINYEAYLQHLQGLLKHYIL
jgi:hypothetical protein